MVLVSAVRYLVIFTPKVQLYEKTVSRERVDHGCQSGCVLGCQGFWEAVEKKFKRCRT
jgi:hypothetical protein